MEKLYDGYDPVAKDKKRDATLWENRRQRMGFGPKTKSGRCREPGSAKANRLIVFMRKMLKRNGLDPIMDLVNEEDLNVCYRVLEMDENLIGERKDEAHLYPSVERENIDRIAKKLGKITLKQWTTFSCALVMLDATSAPCLRPQDILGCSARDFHILNGLLRAILPTDGKNAEELARSVHGLVVNHTKHSQCKGKFGIPRGLPCLRRYMACVRVFACVRARVHHEQIFKPPRSYQQVRMRSCLWPAGD